MRLHFVNQSIQSDEGGSHCWKNSNAITWFESSHNPQIPQNLTTSCSSAYQLSRLLLSDAFPNQFGDGIHAVGTLSHVLHFFLRHVRCSVSDLQNSIGSNVASHDTCVATR